MANKHSAHDEGLSSRLLILWLVMWVFFFFFIFPHTNSSSQSVVGLTSRVQLCVGVIWNFCSWRRSHSSATEINTTNRPFLNFFLCDRSSSSAEKKNISARWNVSVGSWCTVSLQNQRGETDWLWSNESAPPTSSPFSSPLCFSVLTFLP